MEKIIVTGSSGFIAGHLIKAFGPDYKIVGFDLKTGDDVRNLKPAHFEGAKYVFHLAAQARVPLSITNPIMTNSHNIEGTLNVLWCAKVAGVKRVIYSASSSAYGDQPTLPLKEDMKSNPMSPYGIQKLVGEMYCKTFYNLFKMETVSLRYFNVYGENMPFDSPYSAAIARFLDAKRQGKPLTVYGGNQTRDFTYVGDVVRANLFAALSPEVGHGEVINIGSGKNYSIKEVAEAISDNTVYEPQREGEPMHTRADITKAKELLGWAPEQDLITWLKMQ